MTGMSADCGQSARSSPNGSFWQNRTFIVADVNDRLWSAAGTGLLAKRELTISELLPDAALNRRNILPPQDPCGPSPIHTTLFFCGAQ